jgi:hypothetical protein
VNLQAAVRYATVIYEKEKRSSVPTSIIAKHCGTNIKSSKGLRLLATFSQFGLIESTGEGEDRHIRLSSRALDIIVSAGQNDPKRRKAIAEAALHPKVHKTIWDHYHGSLPSDDALRVFLIRELEFQDDKVPQLIKEFRSTLTFAGLLEDDKIDDSDGLEDADNGESSPNIGDYVQWTSRGVDQFPEPRVVAGISDDGSHAFVEGNPEGIPMSELTLQDTPNAAPPLPPKTVATPPVNRFFNPQLYAERDKSGMAEERKTLDEGPAMLSWPDTLSKESVEEFEYWLKGVVRRARRKAGMSPPPPDVAQQS